MFTGIIQLIGSVARQETRGNGSSVVIRLPGDWRNVWTDPLELGESIAVDGICLTIEEIASSGGELTFLASQETLNKSTLGSRRPGEAVNLERAATLQSRLGGHLVSGHIDGRGEIRAIAPQGDDRRLTIGIPPALSRYVVEKGSVAIDGISLTAVDVGADQFDVWIIPHTWRSTTLQHRRPGDAVNFECDMIARMVERLLNAPDAKDTTNWEALLLKSGFKS